MLKNTITLTSNNQIHHILLKLLLLILIVVCVLLWIVFVDKSDFENLSMIIYFIILVFPITYFPQITNYITHLFRSLNSVNVIQLSDDTIKLKKILSSQFSRPIDVNNIAQITVYQRDSRLEFFNGLRPKQPMVQNLLSLPAMTDSLYYYRMCIQLHPKTAQNMNTNGWQVIIAYFDDMATLFEWATQHHIKIQANEPPYQ